MTREELREALSGRHLNPGQVWEWREFDLALLGEEFVRVQESLAAGSALTIARYFGKTPEEVQDLFEFQRLETDNMTMLGLLSATEAALRVDFQQRVADRDKDAVSRRFREMYKGAGLEQRLEEDLLEAWKEHGSNPETKKAVGQFKGALKLRHWLAHGRYWKPKLGAEYDPVEIFAICDAMLQVID